MEIKTLEELQTPDGRSLIFGPPGIGGPLPADYVAKVQQEAIARCELNDQVADGTRRSFERLRTLHSSGVLNYEAYTAAFDLAWLVLEQAFRERFVAYYENRIPLVNPSTKATHELQVGSFDDVFGALKREGSHPSAGWKLRLHSGELMPFNGSFWRLQHWARQEGLLIGQRNKRLDAVHRKIRNSVAHPSYKLLMPNQSGRAITDLAEIINRLWGQATAGGRLYPAPVEREVFVVGWSEDGGLRSQLRPDQLRGGEAENVLSSFVVIRAVPNDDLWEFDSRYERTAFPADFLFGPGTETETITWLDTHEPTGDFGEPHLDRLFVLGIRNDQVTLPLRPACAIGLPVDRRNGEWRLVRADYPNDGFAHVRHLKDGLTCRVLDPEYDCPVEDLFRGSWAEMVEELASRFAITEREAAARVQVPSQFGVAPDVDDQ